MDRKKSQTDWSVLIISGGLLVIFVLASLIEKDLVSIIVYKAFSFAVDYFGVLWQFLFLAIFTLALIMAFSKYGKIRLGLIDKPEISTLKWISMIMTTLLAGGGVFWAAAEPLYHYMSTPPIFEGVTPGTKEAVTAAFSQSYFHWGFLAWAILGTLSTVVLMYAHYHRGMPLKPRSLLYPVFGEELMEKSLLGTVIDASAIIAVAAGTIGPIGFLGLQVAYGLEALYGVPNNIGVHMLIIVSVIAIAVVSAVKGVYKGIQFLSNINVLLVVILMVAILLIGPGRFIIETFFSSNIVYLQQFIHMSTFRGDPVWLGGWTLFFWGWFLGYGPMTAIFISSISKGRTIREIVLAIAFIAPIVTNFWFTVVGGAGVFYELQYPGIISDALVLAGSPAAMIAITQQLPLSMIIAPAFLIVTILFVVTTTDSMAYTIAVAVTGNSEPRKGMRVFWGVLMGLVAIVLLWIGEGSIGAIQSFIIVTAIPVSIVLLPLLWTAPKVVSILAKEQLIRK